MEEEKMDVVDLANELSSICKNSPRISFRISYTATEGNKAIHKAFLQYSHEKANNEYLAAIGKLMETADIFYYLRLLEQEIAEIKEKVLLLESSKQVIVDDTEEKKKTI